MKRMLTIVMALSLACTVGMTAYAEDIENPIIADSSVNNGQLVESQGGVTAPNPVPDSPKDNTGGILSSITDAGSADSATTPSRDYAGELFGDVQLQIDNSYARPINRWLKTGVEILLGVILGVLPTIVVANTAIDIVCIMFKPFMTFFATMMPIQLFSTEVTSVTGVAFAGAKGAAEAKPAADLGDQNKLLYYIRQRAVIVFFGFFVMITMASGAWFKIMFRIINIVVGWIM